MIVLDSYAWIEYFIGSEKGALVKGYLGEEPVTPSIVLCEVARKFLREGFAEDDVKRRLGFILANSEIVEINIEISILSSKAHLELERKAKAEKMGKPSLADGIILATGRFLQAKILTGDMHFGKLAESIYIGK